MESTELKPYGHSTMITLGFVTQIVGLVSYLIGLAISIFSEVNFLVDFGPVYQILFFIGSPILIFVSFLILFKLRNKDVEAFSLIKIIFPIAIFLDTIIVIEGFTLAMLSQLAQLSTMLINILVLIYWNNPSHIRYFRSLKK